MAAKPIAIVGAGFSGSAVALQLRRRAPATPLLLFERSYRFGPGLAYATACARHLLNVPAHNMSIYADQPDHFVEWLKTSDAASMLVETEVGTFAPRSVFGDYVTDEVRKAARPTQDGQSLELIDEEVVDLTPRDDGGFIVTTARDRRHDVAAVVLAWGHPPQSDRMDHLYRPDPWASATLADIDPERPIVIIGTGLTMVDMVLALSEQGAKGPIVAISRRGLLPRRHEPRGSQPIPELSDVERRSVRLLMKRIRHDIRMAEPDGVGWRAVIDAMRPITQRLWHGLPDHEKSRFLRHVRSIWDVHRHRMARPVAESIHEMIARRTLTILRGRVVSITEGHDSADVRVKLAGGGEQVLQTQRIIDATGFNDRRAGGTLRTNLCERGLVQPGPLGIGWRVDRTLRVIGANNSRHEKLFALGPMTRGVFWESTSVPDIRVQAAEIGASLTELTRGR